MGPAYDRPMTTDSRLDELPPIRLTELTECGGCAAKLGADLLADALSGLGADGTATRSSPASSRPTTPPRTASRTTWRSSARSTSFRRSSMTRSRTARSRRPTRCPTCSRWAAGCCSRCRSPRSPRTSRSALARRVFEAAAAKVREAGGSSPAATRSATRSPSTASRSSAPHTPTGCSARAAPEPGDVLLLTKRLGTGLLVSGRRQGRTTDADLDAAIDQMRTLNRAASEVLVAARDPRRDRRHGLRAARPRPGDGAGIGRAARASRRRRCPRWTVRSTSPGQASRPVAPATTAASPRRRWRWRWASRPSSSRSRTTRRPPAGCWRRLAPTSTPSKPTLRRRACSRLASRMGRARRGCCRSVTEPGDPSIRRAQPGNCGCSPASIARG